MPLKLMYITNRPEIAQIAESAGVDRIFVDMEYIGKEKRQNGLDTVMSRHSFEDIKKIANSVFSSEILARINPIHDAFEKTPSTEEEIDMAIEGGADIIMLPFFKTAYEVKRFIEYVDGRVRTMPLVETPEAVENIDKILDIPGIDEIFIGLNDLSIGYGKKFMFELLADGTVEDLAYKFRKKNIPFGFGGIASIGKGMLPSENIIVEHYRLGSSSAILSRSFCNVNQISHLGVISSTFVNGIRQIRDYEAEVSHYSDFFKKNTEEIKETISSITGNEK